ncbi:MAG: IPT/TIG domain-containing protein [Myxococcales bacterium]|nr:IPT/TIG domain-containing protein [Myxococcales bacterium]
MRLLLPLSPLFCALSLSAIGCGTDDAASVEPSTDVPSATDDAGDASDGVDGFDGTADVVTPDGSDGSDGSDATDGTDGLDGVDGDVPEGFVAIAFYADDSRNRSYLDGQIQFTGSFAWDKAKNEITYASSWLPNEREWPKLYDDGPISEGGHEAGGQTKGDGIFSTEVLFAPTEETVLEFGALNEFGNWIWIGPNGQLTVKPGDGGRVVAGGVTFPKFGDRDLRVAIDLAALDSNFASITAETHSVYIKGTMNSWTAVQILDNGKQGDETEGDGIFTYLHSSKLGPHDGLVFPGQHVQFVFVFAFKESEPADGQEYKFPVDALTAGVTAATWDPTSETWVPEPVILEPDSYGNVKNTSVVISGPIAECDEFTPCPLGETCDAGTCVPDDAPECSPLKQCPAGEVCDGGTCVPEDTGPECSAEKPCQDGYICLVGSCVEKPECSAEEPCDDGFLCQSGKCIVDIPAGKTPSVSLIDPAKGPASGGTPVVISGANFATGATVRFGTVDATNVAVKTTGTLTATVPPGNLGPVTVTVKNPDGKEGNYPNGFTYTSFAAPTLTKVAPTSGKLEGGDAVTLTGTGFQPGATVRFGLASASQVSVGSDGTSLSCTSPVGEGKGPVDVTVINPDKQQATLVGGFEYQAGLVQFAVLVAPFDLSVPVGSTPDAARVQIYHPGVTPGQGAGTGLYVELGVGPENSEPAAASWTWKSATYVGQAGLSDNDDLWEGAFPTLTPGAYDFAFRCSLDGETWVYADRDSTTMTYAISAAGTVTIAEPPEGIAIFGISPSFGSVLGGTTITITGQDFVDGATVALNGAAATDVDVVSATEITAKVPAASAGPVTVSVTSGGATASRTEGFRYTYLLSGAPAIDGVIGADWPPAMKLADDTAEAGWDNNDLDVLYAGFDDEYLYIGIAGTVEAANVLALYLDTDFGSGTGFKPEALSDNAGALDNALAGGAIKVFVPGFGAEFAAGAFGGTGQGIAMLDGTGMAGLRGFGGGAGDFWWLNADIVWGMGGVELRIARDTLGIAPGGNGPGHELAFFVRIVNQDGEYSSPEGLPSSANGDGSVDTIVRLWVD